MLSDGQFIDCKAVIKVRLFIEIKNNFREYRK